MRVSLFLLALLPIVLAQTPIQAPNYSPSFPFQTDGTIVWITTLQSIRAPIGGTASRYGADYADYVCQQSGPQSRTALTINANPGVDIFYSRAIICSTGAQTDSALMGRRTAARYMTYGVPNAQGIGGKPVWAFDPYSNPTAYVRIANNPTELIATGINRPLSNSAGTNIRGGFSTFYGTDTATVGVSASGNNNGNPLVNRALATFPAWTGCDSTGQPITGATCSDWSTTATSVGGVALVGAVGNTGSNPSYFTGTFDNTWLDYPDNLVQGTLGTQPCNTPSLFIYCSWIPTADDGYQNGDETGVDCGGSTLTIDGQSKPFCGACPPGYSGPNNGPCVACVAGRYSWFGGSAACQVCAPNAVSGSAATYCTCAVGYALPSNYDPATMAQDGSLCVPLIRGDPQITGLQGQDFQVHGIPDEYFNMVSTPDMQVNSRFVFLNTARCMDNSTTCFTHPGTYIDVMAFTIGGHQVKVLAGTYEQGLRAFIGETEIFVGHKQTLENPTVQVSFLAKNRVLVQNKLFRFVLVNSDNFMNQEVALLDEKLLKLGAKLVKLAAGESVPNKEIPIHGILGQTWQNIAYPAGMFIEGEVADYRVADGAFGTDFVYNKFQA